MARRDVGVFLGLKPQAESYHPFGIKSDKPFRDRTSLALVRKIDSPSLAAIEDEDDDEDDYEYPSSFRERVTTSRKNPTDPALIVIAPVSY
jgi:hypothetical protein